MGNEWKVRKLEDIAQVIDSRHKTPQYSDKGLPMVRVVDVKSGVLQLDETKRVSEEVYSDFSKGRDPEIGDLIISRVGSYGNVAYVNSLDKFCLGQNTALIIPNDKSRFLYYALTSPQIKSQIEQMVVGAVQKTISLKTIKSLEIPEPPIEIKEKVSQVLANIDDKIELNKKTNQTLEQMAQTLFKSWFVDFDPVFDNALAKANYQLQNLPADFPEQLRPKVAKRLAALSASITTQERGNEGLVRDNATLPHPHFPSEFAFNEQLGWVPLGWGSVQLSEFVKFSNGKSHKGLESGKYPLYGANGVIGNVNETKFSDGIIIGRVGAYCGAIEYCSGSFWASDNTIVAIPKAGKELNPFILILLKYLNLNQYAGGAAQPLLNQATLGRICISNANFEIRKHFSLIVGEQLNKIVFNNIQIDNLTKLRDTLLPKLISGELQIPTSEPRSHAPRGNAEGNHV